jgi:hypothetical protein
MLENGCTMPYLNAVSSFGTWHQLRNAIFACTMQISGRTILQLIIDSWIHCFTSYRAGSGGAKAYLKDYWSSLLI